MGSLITNKSDLEVKKWLIGMGVLILTVLAPKRAAADQVRNIYANDKSMQTVNLAMGRSTVLRFDDKPKTAVIGNANYFSLEYLNNDITVQPLGQTVTNLFVYSESQTYGLILRVGPASHYDDLVYVRYRPGYLSVIPGKKSEPLVTRINLHRSVVLGGKIKIDFEEAIRNVPQGVWIIVSEVTNTSNEKITPSDLMFSFSNGKSDIPPQKASLDPDVIQPGAASKMRLFLIPKELVGIAMTANAFGESAKLTFTKKGLK
jgi:hypothetical protein